MLITKPGDKFGRLTLIERDHKQSGSWYWKCRCDCGNEYIAAIKNLRRGFTKSCGCLRPDKMKELVGWIINDITVLKLMGRENNKTLYECKCKCGNTVILSRGQLNDKIENCGECYKYKLINTNKGYLTVIGFENKNNNRYIITKCKCGNEYTMTLQGFLNSIEPHCGCQNITEHELYSIYRGMLFRCYNSNAPQYKNYGGRGIIVCDRWKNSFEAFIEDMGIRPEGHSIDRIDNNGNYEPANCKWSTDIEQLQNRRKHQDIVNDLINKAYQEGLNKVPLTIKYESKL